jgi:hypothetical protein
MAFEVPTTIIVGAGASAGYGYPTGAGLIETIISSTETQEQGSPLDPREKARKKLHDSLTSYDPISIDAFLQHYNNSANKTFIEKAKREIAFAILSNGDERRFNKGFRDDKDDLVKGLSYTYDCNKIISLNRGRAKIFQKTLALMHTVCHNSLLKADSFFSA